jgi:hypothetical protein
MNIVQGTYMAKIVMLHFSQKVKNKKCNALKFVVRAFHYTIVRITDTSG